MCSTRRNLANPRQRKRRPYLLSLTVASALTLVLGAVPASASAAEPGTVSSDAISSDCSGPGHSNPAVVHCLKLGYRPEIAEDEKGGRYSVCAFPDGSSCDAWRFFEGKCGGPHSYCARHGYGVITKTDGKNPFSPHYAVCVMDHAEVGSVSKLMGLDRKYERAPVFPDGALPKFKPNPDEDLSLVLAVPPPSFTWRNHDGEDWMTSVKDQGACGSCWGMSAVGTTEAVYNIYTGFPALDLDLSEEYLNSDCPAVNPGSCCGGSHDKALQVLVDEGVPDDDCMPWDEPYYISGACSCYPNPPCNAACSGLPAACSRLTCGALCGDWANRMVTIDDYFSVPDDGAQIRQKLVDEGPLAVCLAMSGTWDAGVYRCTTCWDRDHDAICTTAGTCTAGVCTAGLIGEDCDNDGHCDEDRNDDGVCDQDDCGVNHCIVMVGYDDAGGHWITKNSWGSGWNGDGYFGVGFGECHIEDHVYYVEPEDINFPPVADPDGPYAAECQGATTALPLDGTGSADPNAGDTLTYSWATTCPGGTFDDDGSATPVLTIDTSAGCVHDCDVTLTVTDDLGESDAASATVTVSDTSAPLMGCPADVTIECDEPTDPTNTGEATATDVCDPSPGVSYSDDVAPGSCPQASVITRTWTGTDRCGNAADCVQTINVVDTTPPTIFCNAPPTITPPDAPIAFTAGATDNCDGEPAIETTGYDCYKFTRKGRRISKLESCVVGMEGATITILDSGGVGDHISWTVDAVDGCGNAAQLVCEVEVANPGQGQ